MKKGEVWRAIIFRPSGRSASEGGLQVPSKVSKCSAWGSVSCVLVSSHPAAEELPGVVGAQLRYGWCHSWVTLLPEVREHQAQPGT